MDLGQWGEERVCRYLEERNYRILDRNFRCRGGELDIVAEQGATLCFIEVKCRRSLKLGLPAESVSTAKQRKIKHAALFYLKCHPGSESGDLRMDVVEVLRCKERVYIRHIENAF